MKNTAFYFLLISVQFASAQQEASNWFFGNYATAEFKKGNVNTSFAGALSSEEACASISDTNGNLLFYTNGIRVWNKNLFVTPNGNDLNGDVTTSQMLIVPNPSNSNLYYIFYADGFGGPNGLQYSEFDITLDNGLGDIVTTTKNTLLHLNATEKIAAILHCNGEYLWLLSMDFVTDEFVAHLITENGILGPVRSKSGPLNGWCCNTLKFSPNGNRLAYTETLVNGGSSDAMLYQFDTQSGLTHLETKIPVDSAEGEFQYGLSFSPNSEILYIGTILYRTSPGNKIEVYQYDLTSPNIRQSKHTLFSRPLVQNGNQVLFGSIQNAPNGKIYIAKMASGGSSGDSLAAINFPDSIGKACGFEFNALYLNSRTSTLGLPNFIESYFHLKANLPDTCAYLSLPDVRAKKTVSVFPNPAQGLLSVEFINEQNWVTLELLDITRTRIKFEKFEHCQKIHVDYSSVRSGFYFLDISTPDFKKTVRVVLNP